MALIPIKCLSCGADITLDNQKEYGFCQYCGTQIRNDAVQTVKIQYSGDPMSTTVNNTNTNVYNINNGGPSIYLSKPKGLVKSLLFIILGIVILSNAIRQDNSAGYIISVLFLVPGVVYLLLFIRGVILYEQAIKNAIRNNNVTNRRK